MPMECNCWMEELSPSQMGYIRRLLRSMQPSPMEGNYIRLLRRSVQMEPMECNCNCGMGKL